MRAYFGRVFHGGGSGEELGKQPARALLEQYRKASIFRKMYHTAGNILYPPAFARPASLSQMTPTSGKGKQLAHSASLPALGGRNPRALSLFKVFTRWSESTWMGWDIQRTKPRDKRKPLRNARRTRTCFRSSVEEASGSI